MDGIFFKFDCLIITSAVFLNSLQNGELTLILLKSSFLDASFILFNVESNNVKFF